MYTTDQKKFVPFFENWKKLNKNKIKSTFIKKYPRTIERYGLEILPNHFTRKPMETGANGKTTLQDMKLYHLPSKTVPKNAINML